MLLIVKLITVDTQGNKTEAVITGRLLKTFENLDTLKDVLAVERFFNDKTDIRCHLEVRE